MRWLVFLLTFPLLANPPNVPTSIDIDPSMRFCDSVDVTTGAYFESHQDLVVKGVVPITIHRAHASLDLEYHPGVWRFHDERISALFSHDEKTFIFSSIHLKEASGAVISFHESYEILSSWSSLDFNWRAVPEVRAGYCNTVTGTISGRNHPGLYRLSFRHDTYMLTLTTGSGEERLYKLVGEPPEKGYRDPSWLSTYPVEFVLEEVRQPNGHRLRYSYDMHGRLTRIEGYGDGLLTWADFQYCSHDGGEISSITTSDGQRVDYHYDARKSSASKPRRQLLLIKVTINGIDEECYDHDQHRIVCRRKPSGNRTAIAYDHNGEQALKLKRLRAFQVAGLRAPVGRDGVETTVCHFDYNFRSHSRDCWTDAYDVRGNRSRYHFTGPGKLYLVERFRPRTNERFWFECFEWQGSKLKRKFTCDGAGYCPSFKTYEYDGCANVCKEIESGCLTGSRPVRYWIGPPYSHEHQGKRRTYSYEPNVVVEGDEERYEKRYTYNWNNNVLNEAYDDVRVSAHFSGGSEVFTD